MGAILTAAKESTVAMIFTMLAFLIVFVFIIMLVQDYYHKEITKKEFFDSKLSVLFQAESLYQENPSDEMRKWLFNLYQLTYHRAIMENENKLATAIKDRMEDLKKKSN